MTRTQFDLSPSHGPIWGAINGAGAALLLAFAGTFLHLPFWLPLPFAAAGILAALIVGHHRNATRGNVIFRVACWAVAGTWAAVTIAIGWSWAGVLVLGGGALLAALLAPVLAPYAERPEGAPGLLGNLTRPVLYSEWEERITRICGFRSTVTVTDIEQWPDNVGYTVFVKFPEGSGYTWEKLRDHERELAASANNPKGCPVRAHDSDYQGAALLKVTRVNALKKEIIYPNDYSPLTVREALPLGLMSDRTLAVAEIRQSAGLIAGMRGGGKTNLLDIFTANLARCPDALIWHIDLNGGGMSVPWMLPYVNSLVQTPTVDWVARTPEEAFLMSQVAVAIAKDRKARYGALKASHNTRLLPVTPQLPEIVILVDEGAEVMGEDASASSHTARNLREVQRIGRAEAVNIVFSTLRATGDHLPVAVRKNAALRIATQVEEDAELDYLFNYGRGLRSADLMYPGCVYLKTKELGSAPVQIKAYHVLPEQIAEIVLATEHLRPQLDEVGKRIGGTVYAERWERTRPYLTAMAGEDGELEIEEVTTDPRTSPAGSPVDKLRQLTEQFQNQITAIKQKSTKPATTAQSDAVLSMPEDELLAELDAIAAMEPTDPRTTVEPVVQSPAAPPAVPTSAAERRALVVQLIDQAGAEGMKTSAIIEAVKSAGITVNDSTVWDWLATEKKAGNVVSPKQGTWMTPRHLGG